MKDTHRNRGSTKKRPPITSQPWHDSSPTAKHPIPPGLYTQQSLDGLRATPISFSNSEPATPITVSRNGQVPTENPSKNKMGKKTPDFKPRHRHGMPNSYPERDLGSDLDHPIRRKRYYDGKGNIWKRNVSNQSLRHDHDLYETSRTHPREDFERLAQTPKRGAVHRSDGDVTWMMDHVWMDDQEVNHTGKNSSHPTKSHKKRRRKRRKIPAETDQPIESGWHPNQIPDHERRRGRIGKKHHHNGISAGTYGLYYPDISNLEHFRSQSLNEHGYDHFGNNDGRVMLDKFRLWGHGRKEKKEAVAEEKRRRQLKAMIGKPVPRRDGLPEQALELLTDEEAKFLIPTPLLPGNEGENSEKSKLYQHLYPLQKNTDLNPPNQTQPQHHPQPRNQSHPQPQNQSHPQPQNQSHPQPQNQNQPLNQLQSIPLRFRGYERRGTLFGDFIEPRPKLKHLPPLGISKKLRPTGKSPSPENETTVYKGNYPSDDSLLSFKCIGLNKVNHPAEIRPVSPKSATSHAPTLHDGYRIAENPPVQLANYYREKSERKPLVRSRPRRVPSSIYSSSIYAATAKEVTFQKIPSPLMPSLVENPQPQYSQPQLVPVPPIPESPETHRNNMQKTYTLPGNPFEQQFVTTTNQMDGFHTSANQSFVSSRSKSMDSWSCSSDSWPGDWETASDMSDEAEGEPLYLTQSNSPEKTGRNVRNTKFYNFYDDLLDNQTEIAEDYT